MEREGIAMTHGQVARADLILEVLDLSEPRVEIELPIPEGAKHLRILNKRDAEDISWQGREGLRISCETGEGFPALEGALMSLLALDEESWGAHSVAVNSRHQACLLRGREALDRGVASLGMGEEPEFTALSLREALGAIGEISGVVDTEEILGEIFGNFCIGK